LLPVTSRRRGVLALTVVLLLLTWRSVAGQGTIFTIISPAGRRSLAATAVHGHEMFALNDLAAAFQLNVQADTLGAITISYKGKTIILTPDQNLASVNGRIVSLATAPTRSNQQWFVPVELVNQALAPIYGERLELRADSHLILEGNVTAPRAPEPAPTPAAPAAPVQPAPARPAPSQPAAPATPPPSLGTPQPTISTIVIDPGHGGSDKGVQGPHGTLEKDITMAVARRLKSAIEGRLGIRVLLTRDGDETLSADARAALANNNKADLFISLHANASFRTDTSGAEIFSLGLDRDAAQASATASSSAQQLPVTGGGSRQVEIVPWQFAQTRFVDQSKTLADLIEQQFKGHVPLDGRAITQAPLRVLVGANMPAVLVEMGYLSNADQENELGTGNFQNAIVQALYGAIVQFRDTLNTRAKATAQGGGAR
jgi:N-acetylmuramoyl-L-alanine amidase